MNDWWTVAQKLEDLRLLDEQAEAVRLSKNQAWLLKTLKDVASEKADDLRARSAAGEFISKVEVTQCLSS